jgi:hypothetical protein
MGSGGPSIGCPRRNTVSVAKPCTTAFASKATDKQQNFGTIFDMQYDAPYVTTNVTLRFERDVLTGISLAQGSEE